jgi:DNA-binding transcriptional LysR family regulator
MNRLEAMSVFVSVVEAGSLSAAGRKLRMPLPTVSRKISELETQLKARLLLRSTRALTLTDAGKAYFASCKRILEDVAEVERAAAGEYRAPTGELIITAPVAFGRLHALPVIAEFLKAYPDVHIRLIQGDRSLNLLEDHIDLAIRIGELSDSNLVATRVGAVRKVVCASPEYLARRGTPKTPQDLSKHDCISFASLMSSGVWRFKAERAVVAVPVQSRLVVNTAEAAIDAALMGAGITRVLSYQVEEPLKAGSLRSVLKKFEMEPVPVSLLYTAQRQLPLKLRAFLDFAAPRLRASLRA